MGCVMTKSALCENKSSDQLHSNRYFLNPKFEASSGPLWPYKSVCVGPCRKPEDWVSRDAAQL